MTENKLNFKIEFVLCTLFFFSFFMPWVDMGMFVKVTGWEAPFVQDALSGISKNAGADATSNYLYTIFIIPLLALIGGASSLFNKTKIARYALTILSIFGIILCSLLYFNLPNIGSGIYILFILSLLSVICLISDKLLRK